MPLYSYLLSSNLTSFFYTAINTLFWGSARGCPGSNLHQPCVAGQVSYSISQAGWNRCNPYLSIYPLQ